MKRKFLGITVMPEFYQNETIDRVLDNLVHVCGATAVATSPYVMQPADAATGSREPPDDAGAGAVRLLDRPLWGKRELYVSTAPSFTPNPKLYAASGYAPPPPQPLTAQAGRIVADFLAAAQAKHLQVFFQVQAAIPPGYRVQFGGPAEADQPRLPDGSIPKRRLAKNGSLAAGGIVRYLEALLADLQDNYSVDGFRIDWPEYPPYFLDDAFLDFGPAAEARAKQWGYDFAAMRSAAGELYQTLHGDLTDDLLAAWTPTDGGRHGLLGHLSDRPALAEWLNFKAELVEDLLARVRGALREPRIQSLPNAFAPPFTVASGFDFRRAAPFCSAASVKLYSMHWPMILHFWAKELLAANPKCSERAVVAWLVRLFDIPPDDDSSAFGRKLAPTLADYRYPEPHEPHPVGEEAMRRKIRQAQAEAAGQMPIYALVHGYGPADDFRRRLAAVWNTADGVWINRYAYLSDEKLKIVGEVCRS